MSTINDAPVFQLTYDLLKDIHVARRSFTKAEKYSLGESLEEAILSLLLAIVEAGQTKRDWKVQAIESALFHLEKTKVLLRLAADLKQLNERRAAALQESIQKIGRMLGGWRKSI